MERTLMAETKNSLSASLEDYLEAILNLSDSCGVVHSKDIAEELGVARPSVTGALRALKERRLVNYKPYGSVTLTDKGKEEAVRVVKKHKIIKSFFSDVLGIDAKTAHKAACKAEHALGQAVVTKLLSFIKFVSKENKNGRNLAAEFKRFCNKKYKKNLAK